MSDQVEKLGVKAILDSPEKLREENDLQLRQLHHRVFQLAANVKAGELTSITMDDLRAAHKLILAEIGRRGLKGEFKTLKVNPKILLRAWHPCTSVIASGEATHYLFPQKCSRRIGEPAYLAEDDHAVGIIELSEPESIRVNQLQEAMPKYCVDPAVIQARWPTANQFWLHPVKVIELFKDKRKYFVPDTNSSWIDKPVFRVKNFYDGEYFKGLMETDADFVSDLASIIRYAEGQTILELGCGTGRALKVFKLGGWVATGLDSSQFAVNVCKSDGYNVLQASAEDVPLDDAYADVVFSMHTLEHLAKPDLAVRESIRLANEKAIHLVPLGERGDPSHTCEFKTLEDLRTAILAMDTGGHAPIFHRNETTNTALIVFDKRVQQLPVLSRLKSFTIVPDFASIAGGAVTRSDPNDIDVVWRANESIGRMETKFRNLLRDTELAVEIDHHLNSQGPHGDHIPIFDLVARLKPEFKLVTIDEPRKAVLAPLQRFKPLKTGKGYTQQEFFAPEQLAFWAKGFLGEGVPLAVEQKYNGYRTVLQKKGNDTLIYFEDSKDDRSKQFPGLVADLHSLGDDVILDADLGAVYSDGTPVDRKELGVFISKKFKAGEDGKFKTASDDDAVLVARVFDALYSKGKALHTEPWTKRRQALGAILGKADTKLMKLGRTKIVNNQSALASEVARVSKLPGSEGAVVKATNSDYPLTGQSMAWAKIKNAVEIKVEVLRRVPVKGAKAWNYWVAYKDENGELQELGKTFNTKVDAKVGDILTLNVGEIIPKKIDGAWVVTAVVPMVADISTVKEPEGVHSIIRRADKANVLQAPPSVRDELSKDKITQKSIEQVSTVAVSKQVEGNLDFKEGDEGTGVLQTHERGLSEEQTKLTHDFGWAPVELTAKQLDRLSELSGKNATTAFKQAQDGSSAKLGALIESIDTEGLTAADRRLIALADPVSVHTDMRLRPGKEPYWEGGEGFTPGNQFKANKFRMIGQQGFDGKILMNFKVPTIPEAGGDSGKRVIRGPLAWMKVGDGKPQVFPPGAVGSSAKAWSRFFVHDKFKWKAGIQDEHFKEFEFDGKLLKGRFIIQYVPTGPGERQWMISRPAKQEYTSEVLKNAGAVVWTAEFVKREPAKRLVTAAVLKPETTDAQGTIISNDVIEAAAHDFVMRTISGKSKGIGYMHRDFGRNLQLVESFITPEIMLIGGNPLPRGTWVMRVKVFDDEVWKKVLNGEIRGFSIGGKAQVSHSI